MSHPKSIRIVYASQAECSCIDVGRRRRETLFIKPDVNYGLIRLQNLRNLVPAVLRNNGADITATQIRRRFSGEPPTRYCSQGWVHRIYPSTL